MPAPTWCWSTPAASSISAKEESLEAIGEAIAENGRVVVTGCFGKEADVIRARFPQVLAITGAHQYEQVVAAVHEAAPPIPSPFLDLVPEAGLKLTPRHYSYLKISEGCNHRCAFCIIPQLRGDLVSRRPDAILREAEKLVAAGTKELLVISQDTSAYGVDIRNQPRMWQGREVRPHMTDLARELGTLRTPTGEQVWVRLHYVYPYPHVDQVIPLMAEGAGPPLSRHSVPARQPEGAARACAARPMTPRCSSGSATGAQSAPTSPSASRFVVGFPGETEEDFDYLLEWLEEAQLDRVGAFRFEPVEGAAANALPDPVPEELKEERYARVMELTARICAAKLQPPRSARRRCPHRRGRCRKRRRDRPLEGRRARNRRRSPSARCRPAQGRRLHPRPNRGRRRARPFRGACLTPPWARMADAPAQQPVHEPVSRASIAIAALSTIVEWYDFTLYLYFATVLSRVFFSGDFDLARPDPWRLCNRLSDAAARSGGVWPHRRPLRPPATACSCRLQ